MDSLDNFIQNQSNYNKFATKKFAKENYKQILGDFFL